MPEFWATNYSYLGTQETGHYWAMLIWVHCSPEPRACAAEGHIWVCEPTAVSFYINVHDSYYH